MPRHVAIIHDYLNQYGGAERVLEALHALYPTAPVYTSIYDPAAMPEAYRTWDIRTSWMQRLPGWRRHFQKYFMLYPSAFESFDLGDYDLIISSSSAYAKGIIPAAHAYHICYCHTPMRFAWRTGDYIKREGLGLLQRSMLPIALSYVRLWDVATTPRVDHFIANSRVVAARIKRYYGRTATIIPPPVELSPYRPSAQGDFYLAGGRLIPYKRLDLVVRAFTALRLPLKIFGDGRDRDRLQLMAGPHIEFLGQISEEQRHELFARCRAFIFPGEEDFGITPLEAMSAGRPVIAYAAGGALETMLEGVTGRFFSEQSAAALAVAVAQAQRDQYDPAIIRRHAEQFGREVFLERMHKVIEESQAIGYRL